MHLVSLHHKLYQCDHTLWEQEAGGSNPSAPTILFNNLVLCSIRWGSIKGFRLGRLVHLHVGKNVSADAVRRSATISQMGVNLGHSD